MHPTDITDDTFEATLKDNQLVLVDFWAPWCGPCLMLTPIIEEINAEMHEKVKIGKLNVDENQQTAMKFGVMSIPTMIIFKGGEVADTMVGVQSKDAIKAKLEEHLA